MKKIIVGTFVVGMTVAGAVFAQQARDCPPNVKERLVNQQQRIRQGVRSEELTRREAVGLEREQRAIVRDARKAKSDGDVTRKERAHVHHEQNQASRHIFRQKHDPQDR